MVIISLTLTRSLMGIVVVYIFSTTFQPALLTLVPGSIADTGAAPSPQPAASPDQSLREPAEGVETDLSLPLINTSPVTTVLAQHLADQLRQHHGCPDHSGGPAPHRQAHSATISQLVSVSCPDILSRADLKPHPADWDTIFPAAARRGLFSGIHAINTAVPYPTGAGESLLDSPWWRL